MRRKFDVYMCLYLLLQFFKLWHALWPENKRLYELPNIIFLAAKEALPVDYPWMDYQ